MSKKFSEAGFPAPNQYDDWRSWAASFLVALDSLSGEEVHNFPLYRRDPEKTREGLPAGVDGDMIRVLDEDTQQRLYVFENGSWERAQEDILRNLDYVVEWKSATAADPTWYRVYKSGWVEQGGKASTNNNAIQLPKEMADTNYWVVGLPQANSTSSFQAKAFCVLTKTTTTIAFGATNDAEYWEVKGQGA